MRITEDLVTAVTNQIDDTDPTKPYVNGKSALIIWMPVSYAINSSEVPPFETMWNPGISSILFLTQA